MEKSDDPLQQPMAERYPDRQWLLKGVLATAVFVGFGNAIIRTWDLFYDNWKNNSMFADIRKERDSAKAALSKKIETYGMDYREVREAQQTIENTWSKKFNERLRTRIGVESEGPLGAVKGTWQRFNSLGNYTRPKIVFSTALTTAAAIGGYVLMNQNAHMKRDMNSVQARLDLEREKASAQTQQR